jgi:hypothetical protein
VKIPPPSWKSSNSFIRTGTPRKLKVFSPVGTTTSAMSSAETLMG